MRIIILSNILLLLANFTQIEAQNKQVLDSLMTLYREEQTDSAKLDVLIEVAYEYRYNQPDTCIIIAQKIFEKSEKLVLQGRKAAAMKLIAIAYRTQGKYTEAINFLQKALVIYKNIENKQGAGGVLNDLGTINKLQGDYLAALESYQQCLKIARQINSKQGEAATLSNIGALYAEQKKLNLARKYYHDALKVMKTIGDKEGVSSVLNSLGTTYSAQNKLSLALKYYNKSLKVSREINYKLNISYTLNNIAEVRLKQGRLPLALDYYEKSLRIKEEIDNSWGQIYSLLGIAQVYQKQKDYDKSLAYAHRADSIARQIDVKKEIADASKVLSESYKAKQDYRNALKYHELYQEIQDSLFNVEKSKAIANLEAKVQIEKQQAQIEKEKKARVFQQDLSYLAIIGLVLALIFAYFIFRSRQKERKAKELILKQKETLTRQSQQLTEANNAKDKLFAILGHDLRSPVNSLQSFLELMQQGLISREDFEKHLPTFYNNVKNLQNTLNNLLVWSVSQMNGIRAQPKQLDAKELITEGLKLFNNVAATKNISLKAEVPKEEITTWADEDHFRLLLRNLINNAIKFTDKGGEIKVSIEEKPTTIEVSIADNGRGMSKEQLTKLFEEEQQVTTRGTSGERGTGLGLQLCQEIISENKGEIWASSEEAKGSTFTFSLPKIPQDNQD